MNKILIVEDNKDLAVGLCNNLQIEGYQVHLCHDGGSAFAIIENLKPELIILDMMLPDIDGFQIIQALQKSNIKSRILCLTARSEEIDKVRALRSGADDYLTKPFGLMELLARVEALLRRNIKIKISNSLIEVHELKIDIKAKLVFNSNKTINLTPKEYDLLLFMVNNKNKVHSRLELMKHVWGHLSEVNSRTVDTHIAELRKKIEADPSNPNLIITVPKSGYIFHYNE